MTIYSKGYIGSKSVTVLNGSWGNGYGSLVVAEFLDGSVELVNGAIIEPSKDVAIVATPKVVNKVPAVLIGAYGEEFKVLGATHMTNGRLAYIVVEPRWNRVDVITDKDLT